MNRMQVTAAVFLGATLFWSAPGNAQIAPAIPRAQPAGAPAAPEEPPVAAPVEPVAPPPYAPPPPAEPPAVVAAPAPAMLPNMSEALGFGIGVIPNTELAGTTGAVAIKYWISDELAVAPLFSFSYDKPHGAEATWHLRPEAVLLFAPFATRWTRFEIGGGLGFSVSKAAGTPSADGMILQPNTQFTLALPIQAGVEHFFAPWLSLGIAARADLFAYSQDGDYHEVSFTVDSTSLLGQLFFYTD